MDFALDDTIAAIATAPGEAGLAVVRLSGANALPLADAVFCGACRISGAAGGTLHHGWLAGGERVDEVVAGVFRAPKSYTREDVVEFSCHGGPMPARSVLALLLASGARMARPGEFTLRAFLNGRLDLVQAEAVAELIHARNEVMQRAALARLGELSRGLREELERVADLVAEVEARVDFAEDVGGVEVPPAIVERIREVEAALGARLAGAQWGRALRDGVPVAIVGRPNAGKSSVFNRLVGEERAIVTAVPGTTRDRVSATVEWRGALFTLSDTAGLRETTDEVEVIGVARARLALEDSHVVLWVVDGSEALHEEDRHIARSLAGRRAVIVLNKQDLGTKVSVGELVGLGLDGARILPTTALPGRGLEAVAEAVTLCAGFVPGEALTVERQAHLLERSCAALARATRAAVAGEPGEIVSLELRESLGALEELLGVRVSEGMLDRIFSRFCIGK